MAPFNFNLQPLLDLRERTEDERKRDYASSIAEHNRTLGLLRIAQAELGASLQKMRSNLIRVDPRAMEDAFAEVTYLRAQVQFAQRNVDQAAAQVHARREALREATREKNVLEKLKERRREAYLEARRLREEEEIDDTNVIRTSNAATLRRESENL